MAAAVPGTFPGQVVWVTPAVDNYPERIAKLTHLTAAAFAAWPRLWRIDMHGVTQSGGPLAAVRAQYYEDGIHHGGALSAVPWYFLADGLGCTP